MYDLERDSVVEMTKSGDYHLLNESSINKTRKWITKANGRKITLVEQNQPQ
jgi:hypothetical protein